MLCVGLLVCRQVYISCGLFEFTGLISKIFLAQFGNYASTLSYSVYCYTIRYQIRNIKLH